MFADIDLSAFPPEREDGLRGVYRYTMFERMDYRSNLWMHAQRMLWLVEAIAPVAQKHLPVDIEKARVLALVHDDTEMIIGDIPASFKTRMSAQETDALDLSEEKAIAVLAARYPQTVHGYAYTDLLTSMIQKDTVEAQFVSYIDKFDAYCESMHEFHGGNLSILRSIMFYVNAVAQFPQKYPALEEFLSDKTSPITFTENRNNLDYVVATKYDQLKPFTKENVLEPSDFPFYDEWKRIVVGRGGDEGVRWLTVPCEYNMPK